MSDISIKRSEAPKNESVEVNSRSSSILEMHRIVMRDGFQYFEIE